MPRLEKGRLRHENTNRDTYAYVDQGRAAGDGQVYPCGIAESRSGNRHTLAILSLTSHYGYKKYMPAKDTNSDIPPHTRTPSRFPPILSFIPQLVSMDSNPISQERLILKKLCITRKNMRSITHTEVGQGPYLWEKCRPRTTFVGDKDTIGGSFC